MESEKENPQNEIRVIIGKGKKYEIGGKEITQKPLIMRDFVGVFDNVMELVSTVLVSSPKFLTNNENLNIETINPESLIALTHVSKDALDRLYNILAIALKTEKEFLLDNMTLEIFTDVVADFFELNDVKKILENFRKMGSRVKQQLAK